MKKVLLKTWLVCVLQWVIAGSVWAQGHLFDLQKLAKGIYAAVPKSHVLINANSLIIDAGDYYIFTESHSSDEVARRLYYQVAEKLGKKPIRYVILTHSHFDHASGSNGYLALFPNVQVFSTVVTKNDLVKQKQEPTFALESYLHAQIEEGKLGNTDSAAFWLADAQQSHRDKGLPNKLITEFYTLQTSRYTLKIYERKGHTDSDLIIHIPEAKILATGDLLHSYDPIFHHRIEEWVTALEFIQSLPARYIVGGHGQVLTARDKMADYWLNYFDDLKRIAAVLPHGQTISPEEVVKRLSPSSHKLLTRVKAQHLQYLHRIFRPNLEKLSAEHVAYFQKLNLKNQQQP